MKREEICECYNLPEWIVNEYENYDFLPKRTQYDENDLNQLSMMMTLYELDFDRNEIKQYMKLAAEGKDTSEQRIWMLKEKRNESLNEIHKKEEQLMKLDVLWHRIQKEEE